jgi:RHS repeat-associated protein
VDHISARALTEVRYKAWGEDRDAAGAPPTSYRYTGQRSEMDGIGLYYYKARWYDPALGRFVQADPIVPDPYNPLDWDRYAYVRSNPLKYVDPSGYFCEMVGSNEICSADYDSNGHWLPSSQHFERGAAVPLSHHPQADLIKQNLQETIDTGLRIFLEPYDWARVGVDCYYGECSGWDFLGLLPLLPAGITKHGKHLGAVSSFAKSGETVHTIRGKAAHINYRTALGPGYQYEYFIRGVGRADAVDLNNNIVRELKPDNPRAIALGWRQVTRYAQELQRRTGQVWQTFVDTYKP